MLSLHRSPGQGGTALLGHLQPALGSLQLLSHAQCQLPSQHSPCHQLAEAVRKRFALQGLGEGQLPLLQSTRKR